MKHGFAEHDFSGMALRFQNIQRRAHQAPPVIPAPPVGGSRSGLSWIKRSRASLAPTGNTDAKDDLLPPPWPYEIKESPIVCAVSLGLRAFFS